jgi:hypothetical protein
LLPLSVQVPHPLTPGFAAAMHITSYCLWLAVPLAIMPHVSAMQSYASNPIEHTKLYKKPFTL